MFGPRLTRIFASRWAALWWAGGILLLAWQVADQDASAPADVPAQAHSDPWAIDSK